MVQALVGSGGDAPQRWGELEEADMDPGRAVSQRGCHGSERRIDFRDTGLAGVGEEEGPDWPAGPGRGGRAAETLNSEAGAQGSSRSCVWGAWAGRGPREGTQPRLADGGTRALWGGLGETVWGCG